MQKENESIGIRHTSKPSKDKYVNQKNWHYKIFCINENTGFKF